MPNVPWEGGWSNYTTSQSVTGSYRQYMLCDSLSNTASLTFLKRQHEASVFKVGTGEFWFIQTKKSKNEFLSCVTCASFMVGSFMFFHMMVCLHAIGFNSAEL